MAGKSIFCPSPSLSTEEKCKIFTGIFARRRRTQRKKSFGLTLKESFNSFFNKKSIQNHKKIIALWTVSTIWLIISDKCKQKVDLGKSKSWTKKTKNKPGIFEEAVNPDSDCRPKISSLISVVFTAVPGKVRKFQATNSLIAWNWCLHLYDRSIKIQSSMRNVFCFCLFLKLYVRKNPTPCWTMGNQRFRLVTLNE